MIKSGRLVRSSITKMRHKKKLGVLQFLFNKVVPRYLKINSYDINSHSISLDVELKIQLYENRIHVIMHF